MLMTLKFDGRGEVIQDSVVAIDGKTQTMKNTGTNGLGQKVDTTVLFERQ